MTQRSILVTGAAGLLGAHVAATFASRRHVVGLDRHPWWGDQDIDLRQGELADGSWVEETIRAVRPSAIVHCAALTNVDACEEDPVAADLINAQLTRRVVRAAGDDCLMVYVTTDGIFRGDEPLLTEAALPCPRTAYGRTKLRGEWEVQIAAQKHLIVRTNFFGWSSGRKQSSAEWLYSSLASRRPLTAFDDFYFTPIYVVHFVAGLIRLMEFGHAGIFHLCGRDRVSKYQFVHRMAELAGFDVSAVRAGSIADAALPADRPRDMSLDSSRFSRTTGVALPGCDDGLRRFLSDRELPLSRRVAGLDSVAAGRKER